MNNTLKITLAGLAGIVLQNIFVDDLYTPTGFFLGFAVFLTTFMTVKIILGKLPLRLVKLILKYVIMSFVVGIFIGVIYIAYLLNTPPSKSSFLERNQYSDIFTTLNIHYAKGLTNREYSEVAYKYRLDLADYYKGDLSSLEYEMIWGNYKKIYVLQKKTQFLFYDMHNINILGDILKYRYNSQIKSYMVDGNIQTYSNGEKGAIIYTDFTNEEKTLFSFKDYGLLLRVDLPYFNNSLPIHKDDKENYILLNEYLHKTYALLQKNRQYKNRSTDKYSSRNRQEVKESFYEEWSKLSHEEQQKRIESFDKNKPIKGIRQGL